MARPLAPNRTPFNPTATPIVSPSPTPPSPPPTTRRTARHRRVPSNASTTNTSTPAPQAANPPTDSTTCSSSTQEKRTSTTTLPPYYHLAPTVPTPFSGTLDAALDAILLFNQRYNTRRIKGFQPIIDALLSPVEADTAWHSLLLAMSDAKPAGTTRLLWTDLVFLVTRTLLPEAIAENRGLLARLYERRKHLAIRLVLRYDMVREWKMEYVNSSARWRDMAVTVASEPAPAAAAAARTRTSGLSFVSGKVAVIPPPKDGVEKKKKKKNVTWYREDEDFRRALIPNILPTLIAAPEQGYSTHGVRERMKHHVTDLDAYLVITDEEAAGWSSVRLLGMACTCILHWQWVRQNNDILADMEVRGWDELDGKAEECEWIADEMKKPGTGGAKGVKRGRGKEKEKENDGEFKKEG
ncbi:hypothetical protein GMOD_00003512 [Pyrenophora seminiperda CCB06]|uniref:Uncharacterized protein n=1 Tax=Pyrenophora seminiperda CCB06 TaxID=1302712 RepID=A0A3M7MJ59_9PLEO|nr:hypothetical protein GMOD_00003512 [Pyrenophora seminiperda CCB06]